MERLKKDPIVSTALLVSMTLMASQVAGKALRDALFLSYFEVTSLPAIIICSAFLSFGAVLLASRLMALYGPKNVVQISFGLSGLAVFGQCILLTYTPELAAVLFYLHQVVVGSILVSGFWSIINESFDPQVVKRRISFIACAGTVGGIIGCLLAEAAALQVSYISLLSILAGMHLVCAFLIYRSKVPSSIQLRREEKKAAIDAEAKAFGFVFRVLKEQSYSRNLAGIILLAAVSSTLVSYAFKAQASLTFQGPELLRFFAIFYTFISVLTFTVQVSLSRISLERIGGAKSVATLPSAVGFSAVIGVLLPGLVSSILTRGIESVLRNSIFKTGYEFLYTPLSKQEKRSTKSVIDVGFDRLGDMIGGGSIYLIILLAGGISINSVLGLTVLVSLLSLIITIQLQKGYFRSLENRLLRHAPAMRSDASFNQDIHLEEVDLSLKLNPLAAVASEPNFVVTKVKLSNLVEPAAVDEECSVDSIEESFIRLRRGDLNQVLTELEDERSLHPQLAPQVIQLLGRKRTSQAASSALQTIAGSITGLLTDTLLDPKEELSIRRQIPLILSGCSTQRSADALLLGLRDPHFEIRFQCGRALLVLKNRLPEIEISPESIYKTLKKELEFIGSNKPHSNPEIYEGSFLTEGIPTRSVNWQIEHLFIVLSLLVDPGPLKIALQGLHSKQNNVRGTALEYLKNIIPVPIRSELIAGLEEASSLPQQVSDD